MTLWRFCAFFALLTPAAIRTSSGQTSPDTYLFATLAGNPGRGSDDGTGSAARFWFPQNLATDGNGNVYVADSANNTIRKITPSGVVTTLAGLPNVSGSADGVGDAARFSGPGDVAVDSGGNVFVADTLNHTIRKITPAGVVTTVAGSAGSPGSSDGTVNAGRFNQPLGLCIASGGTIYVADTLNSTIRKITAAGVVTTFAGAAGQIGTTNGTRTASRFNHPSDVAIDSAGRMYVADTDNNVIRKINTAGNVSTFAGSTPGNVDGTGSAAQFGSPAGITVTSDGTIYVADMGTGAVRRISPTAVVTTLTDSNGNVPQFGELSGVTVDGSATVYVTANSENVIGKVTSNGVATVFAGAARDGKFVTPFGVGTNHNGIVYVADWNAAVISRITPDGQVDILPGPTGTERPYSGPEGIIADDNDNITVADTFNHAIRKITAARVVTTLAGTPGSNGFADGFGGAARFQFPSRLAMDSGGNVYVADTWNLVVRKITAAGEVSTIAGTQGITGSADGPANSASFNAPSGIAVDADHNLYVSDTGNNTVRKISSDGVVSTIAGSAGQSGNTDGSGSAARFNGPNGLAVDTNRNIYVADTGNHIIRRISPQSAVTTIGGLPGISGSRGGIGYAARFNYPDDIAVDDIGNIYVADTDNSSIRIAAAIAAPQLLKIMFADGGGHPYPLLFGQGAPNRNVTISASDSLVAPFNQVGAPRTNAVGNYRFDDTASANHRTRFYRATVPTQ